jgi:hypothetical protein
MTIAVARLMMALWLLHVKSNRGAVLRARSDAVGERDGCHAQPPIIWHMLLPMSLSKEHVMGRTMIAMGWLMKACTVRVTRDRLVLKTLGFVKVARRPAKMVDGRLVSVKCFHKKKHVMAKIPIVMAYSIHLHVSA